MTTTVFYHASCADGWCSAWLLKRHYPDAVLIPVQYGDPLPETTAIDKVFVVDFSWTRAQIIELARRCNQLTVIDHHATAIADLAGLECETITGWVVRLVLDSRYSGAMLVWKELYGDRPSPGLVAYVQDRDTWKWELPNSRAINAYIGTIPFTTEEWNEINNTLNDSSGIVDIAFAGAAVLREQQRHIDSAVKRAGVKKIAGYVVPCVNATAYISEIGERLCKGQPFSATFFVKPSGEFVYSLRSDKDGLNVAEIAEKFEGGGGHPRASGFTVKPGEAML